MDKSEKNMAGKAVVLLSGGVDSSTTAALAIRDGRRVFALTFDYGQRHRVELQAAKRVAESLGVEHHKVISVDLRQIGGSALTDDIAVPKNREIERESSVIPVTYVPARNLILLSLAVGWAEVIGANSIFIGANAIDYSGYPDCRPDFIAAFESVANLATRQTTEGNPIRIEAPLIHMTKAQIIRAGTELGVDYRLTVSCYDPDEQGRACGACDSCVLRRKGFAEAGVADPTLYSSGSTREGKR